MDQRLNHWIGVATYRRQQYENAVRMRDALIAEHAIVRRELAERNAEIERLRADAERYRWLRDVGDETWTPFSKRTGYSADEADAAIDAAIKEQSK